MCGFIQRATNNPSVSNLLGLLEVTDNGIFADEPSVQNFYPAFGGDTNRQIRQLLIEEDGQIKLINATWWFDCAESGNELVTGVRTTFNARNLDSNYWTSSLRHHGVYVKEEKAFAGVKLVIDDKGDVCAFEGLVKDEDAIRLEAFRNPNSRNDNDSLDDSEQQCFTEQPFYTDVMTKDIAAFRKSITKVAIVNNISLGEDLAMFGLCFSVFGESRWNSVNDITVSNTFEDSSKNHISGSNMQETLDNFFANVDRSWVKKEKLDSFKAFRNLTNKTKKGLCSYCAAISFNSYGVDDESVNFSRYLMGEAKLNSSLQFRPTTENFFKRLSKNSFVSVAEEIMGSKWLADNKSMKRVDICEVLEKAVNGDDVGSSNSREFLRGWLPKGI